MTLGEFKTRYLRSKINPILFYLPVKKKSKKTYTVTVEITDEAGLPFEAKRITISYQTLRLCHNVVPNGDGTYTVDQDEENKGYAFEADYEWRYPVPNPSSYEILPLPNFQEDPPIIEGAEIVSANTLSITLSFSSRSKIKISNMPAGHGRITFSKDSNYFDKYELINNIEYYPEYYTNYENSVDRGAWQIDKKGNFSGFSMYYYSRPQYGYQNEYDFYCVTDKFQNNTMPVTITLKHTLRFVATLINVPGYTGENFIEKLDEDVAVRSRANYYSNLLERTTEIRIGSKISGIKIYIDDVYKGTVSSKFFVDREKSPQIITNISFNEYNAMTYDLVQSSEPQVSIWDFFDSYVFTCNGSKAYNTPPMVLLDNYSVPGRDEYFRPVPYTHYLSTTLTQMKLYNIRKNTGSTNGISIYERGIRTDSRFGIDSDYSTDGGLYFYPVGNEHLLEEDIWNNYSRQGSTPTNHEIINNTISPWNGHFTETEVGRYRYAYFVDITPNEYVEYMSYIDDPNYTTTYEIEN